MSPTSLMVRLLGLAVAAATLVAGTPVLVPSHADHGDRVVHLEHHHGDHGGLLELDDARILVPVQLALPAAGEIALPEGSESIDSVFARPLWWAPDGRAPPGHRPRAPPHLS